LSLGNACEGEAVIFHKANYATAAGQSRTVPFPTPAHAQAALDKQRRRKERRGYV